MDKLTLEQAVKVHEWADRCVVKVESYWCDIQRTTIEYEVTHYIELERFGVEHHSEKSLINEALEILSQSGEVMGRVVEWVGNYRRSQHSTLKVVGQIQVSIDSLVLLNEALSLGMTLKDMGVEG